MNCWLSLIVLFAYLNTELDFVLSAPTTKSSAAATKSSAYTSSIVTRPVRTKKPPKQAEFDPQKFLLANGYGVDTDSEKTLEKKFGSFTDLSKNENFKRMIKIYQSLHNLTITGVLDTKTKDSMLAPRCGLPELPAKIAPDSSSKPQSKPGTAFGSYKTASKWQKDELTWALLKFTPDLGEAKTRAAINDAFKYWSDVSSLKFKEVCAKCTADLKLDFGEYHHGDPYPFDGSGRVLAHAFFPSDGRIHFDDAERFTEGARDDGINLRIVAAHEIGHALGMDHSDVYESLMAPTYRFSHPFKLHNDDIQGIQSLYPKKAGPSTSKPNTTPKGSGIKSPVCTDLIDTAFEGSNKNEIRFIINQDELWGYNILTKKWSELQFYDAYEKIQAKVRGGARDGNGYTWFFRGKQAWAYNGNKLVSGYPRLIYDRLFPNNPQTAVFYNGAFYVLKANLAYKFDTRNLRVLENPQYIYQLFPGVEDWTEAALSLGNDIFFIRDKTVSKFNPSSKRVEQRLSKMSWSPFCDSWRV